MVKERNKFSAAVTSLHLPKTKEKEVWDDVYEAERYNNIPRDKRRLTPRKICNYGIMEEHDERGKSFPLCFKQWNIFQRMRFEKRW